MGVDAREQICWDALELDCERESKRIEEMIHRHIGKTLNRRGAVVALSGGIDSSVVGALCVRALGAKRVFGLMLPETDSSTETRQLSRLVAGFLGVEVEEHDITRVLAAAGCYKYRDEAIRSVIPEYRPGYRCKLVLPSLLEQERLRVFSIVVESPDGERKQARLPLKAYLQVVAATNFKQRVRKMIEYYHADRLHYAVIGTPNRQEYDQGFFVKLGDGAADMKPIAHLYKTQVYQMARYLGLPREICDRPPTTDTYSMPQEQEEFYFSVPYDVMDACLYGKNHGLAATEVAGKVGLQREQVERIYHDIDAKRRATRYQHLPPQLVEPVAEIDLRGSC
jgi:NAD+ synthase